MTSFRIIWYGDYRFGSSEIFNPWSVIGYFNGGLRTQSFWQATGSNEIIGEVLAEATPEITKKLELLMQEDSFLTNVDTDVIYPQIKNKPSSVYSFLLVTGYLTVHWLDMQTDGTYMCQVRVPNKEIALVYSKEILDNLETVLPQSVAVTVQEALYTGNVPVLQSSLELFLCQAISYFDTAQEAFYHGLVLGLCALLNRQYRVVSNRESENGRPDIMLIPREKRLPGIVIELKACRSGDEAQLDRLAKEAVKQIKERGYDAGMKASGVNMVLKYGVAFCGKRVKAARE